MIQKIYAYLTGGRAAPETFTKTKCDGFSDPLDHPVLKAMNARDLADIPFPRPKKRDCAEPFSSAG